MRFDRQTVQDFPRHGPQVLGRRLLDALLPPLCGRCKAPVADPHALCAACWGKLSFIAPPVCLRCGLPLPQAANCASVCAGCLADPPRYDRARSAALYDDGMRPLIIAFKHGDRLDLLPLLARLLGQAGGELAADADLLAPVPLHRWRLFHRRYNQAAALAQALARTVGKRYEPHALERRRATPAQGGLSRTARLRNVAGAFAAVEPARIAGRRVLLIDDVHTTGATLDACALALKRAGAARVDALTLARVALVDFAHDGEAPRHGVVAHS